MSTPDPKRVADALAQAVQRHTDALTALEQDAEFQRLEEQQRYEKEMVEVLAHLAVSAQQQARREQSRYDKALARMTVGARVQSGDALERRADGQVYSVRSQDREQA